MMLSNKEVIQTYQNKIKALEIELSEMRCQRDCLRQSIQRLSHLGEKNAELTAELDLVRGAQADLLAAENWNKLRDIMQQLYKD